jgi:hypothetical protein
MNDSFRFDEREFFRPASHRRKTQAKGGDNMNRCFSIAEEKCNAKESQRCNQMICATEARQSVNSSGRSENCASP